MLPARFNADGSPDVSFGTDGMVKMLPWPATINALAVQPDGKIVFAGGSQSVFMGRFKQNGVPAGLYFIKAIDADGVQTGKVIIQR